MARLHDYERKVQPYLAEITDMALYMTEEQIAHELGVGRSTFSDYKRKHAELQDALKKGRKKLVKELRSVLIQKAKGMTYTEKKTITDAEGNVRTEVTERKALPDLGSIHLLLKNYDSENWAEDPNALKLKKEELELKKQMADWK